tara:strand:- start:18483 stop:19325 length:843 start_codon:yes stop_codon:yes gene_type:complete
MISNPLRVSVHGGHSGQFCSHAEDTLEDIIREYIRHGYAWVGITEHMPPEKDELSYPEEAEAQLSAVDQQFRFAEYIATCRRLQDKYASKIRIIVGFEAEAYPGYEDWVPEVRRQFEPDYIVGSVHHINGQLIDSTPEAYHVAAKIAGGLDELYCAYFDQQYDLIRKVSPEVIGHFDLIRIFDSDYHNRLVKPQVWQRILRNLKIIQERKLIMDFNLAALKKGQSEPYISNALLDQVQKMGISVVPGDDSHSVQNINQYWDLGVAILQQKSFNLAWRCPA